MERKIGDAAKQAVADVDELAAEEVACERAGDEHDRRGEDEAHPRHVETEERLGASSSPG
jgi:hypothetical protein